MATFDLTVRYSRELSNQDLPCYEEHFGHGEMSWTLPTNEVGLVLVDCWDQHAGQYPLRSVCKQSRIGASLDRLLQVKCAYHDSQ